MALYLVVRHVRNTHQTYVNSWIDDETLQAIETPTSIADMCEEAMKRNERVFVHRCGWEDSPPSVCCSALVEQVGVVDEHNSLVTFGQQPRVTRECGN